jgi:hypothetical protein
MEPIEGSVQILRGAKQWLVMFTPHRRLLDPPPHVACHDPEAVRTFLLQMGIHSVRVDDAIDLLKHTTIATVGSVHVGDDQLRQLGLLK